MEITSVSVYALRLPLERGTYTMSHGRTATSYVTTIVQLRTDGGITGYGESCTAGSAYLDGFAEGVQAGVKELASSVIGLDPFETAVLNARMDTVLRGQLAAKSPIDVACWDIKGQAFGVPISTLLGGCFYDTIPLFDAISLGTPEEMAAYASEMRQAGYRHYQVKLGNDPAEDIARVRAVVEAAGEWDFMTCDGNAGWARAEAVKVMRALDQFEVFFEQPCPTIQEMADIRARSRLPILACEVVTSLGALVEIIDARAADAINLKPTRVGGITKAAQIRDLAQAMGIQMLVDEPGGGDIAEATIRQLAASTRPDRLIAMPGGVRGGRSGVTLHVAGDSLFMGERGRIKPLTAPGLGITVQEPLLGSPLFTVGAD